MPRSADAQGFHNWKARAISQDEYEFAAISLAVALGAAYAVCAQLAARSRLQATIEPTYRGTQRPLSFTPPRGFSTRPSSSWIPE